MRLGINIDHVATIRNARNEGFPDLIKAGLLAKKAGADGITAHLREDRRHVQDADIFAIKEHIDLPLNFEMAATDEMLAIALKAKPNACCIVPEKREELTTEGGLDLHKNEEKLVKIISELKNYNIKTSLFVEPSLNAIDKAKDLNADIVEIHTGNFCNLYKTGKDYSEELEKIVVAVSHANNLNIEPHAGHGLDYETTEILLQKTNLLKELNIGHFIIAQSIFDGMEQVTRKFKRIIEKET